jgi:hypothetical protein
MAPTFELRGRRGGEIKDLRSWGKHGKPASAKDWKKGYSAMELARSWSGEHGPEALQELLDRVTGTAGFEPKNGVAEAHTRFDGFSGPRNHDLLLVGEAAGGKTVVSIEGKVNETFGETLSQYRDKARRKIAKKESTNMLDRMQGLTKAIGGWDAGADPKRMELRYQLFSAIAGTVAAAVDEEADQAVFLVQELHTKQLDEKKAKRNEKELRDFLFIVFGEVVTGDDPSWLVGPLKLAGGSERIPKTMPLYVGKLCTPPASS